MRKREVSDSWIQAIVVRPGFAIAGALLWESRSGHGLVILVPVLAVTVYRALRRRKQEAHRLKYRAAFVTTIACLVFLLRPPAPDRVPNDLAELLLQKWLETPRATVYFVSVDGQDPGEELSRRLRATGARFKPRSNAMIGGIDYPESEDENPKYNFVKDRDTGMYGTILSVENLERPGLFTLEVDRGYLTGGLNAGGERSVVMYLFGWRIVGATGFWAA
ncbi:MAG: hypothetical protein V3T86_14090 [Planctomycetota bacterium]